MSILFIHCKSFSVPVEVKSSPWTVVEMVRSGWKKLHGEALPVMKPCSSKKVVNIFARTGNQVAASIPSALDHAVRSQQLRRGQTALLVGTSAGISLGGTVLRF